MLQTDRIYELLDEANILGKTGQAVELATVWDNDLVGVYFSAHWCPPCRGFTPQFAEVYNQLKSADKKVEVIFVSSDSDQEAFDAYYGEMPWLALDYANRSTKNSLSDLFGVEGIPTLVWIDPKNGTVNKDGRKAVADAGVDYFPWSPEMMAKAESEREEREAKKRADKLAVISAVFNNWGCLGETDVSALRECEAVVALVGSFDGNCKYVVPELKTAHSALGTRLGVVYLPTASSSDEEAFQQNMPDSWIKMTEEDAKTLVGRLPTMRDNVHAYVLSGDGSCINTSAAIEISRNNETNFPGEEEVLEAKAKAAREAEEKAQREAAEFKATHFGKPGLSFLEGANVVGKDGKSIDIESLLSNDLIGLYFSAHWCGP
jgi:nucleoredoxin